MRALTLTTCPVAWPNPNADGVPPVPLCAVKSPPWHMNCAPELRVRLRVRAEVQVEAGIRVRLGLGLGVRASLRDTRWKVTTLNLANPNPHSNPAPNQHPTPGLRDDTVEGGLLVAEAGLHRAQLAEVLRRLGGELGEGESEGEGAE